MPGARTRLTQLLAGATVVATLVATPSTAQPSTAQPGPAQPGPAHQRAAADRAGTVGAAGIGDGYFPLDGNGGYDVERYAVRNRWDQRAGRLSGTTTVRATATQRLTRFNLDLLLPVRSVVVGGRPARFVQRGHELAVTPARAVSRGDRLVVRVSYAGRPAELSYLGERNWLDDGRETVTMNQPHMAPWWFAANDHPRDKAAFDIRITTRADRTVVSNGTLVGRTPHRDGTATTHWRSPEPMATYLAFFAVGRYQVETGVRDGLPWYVAVSRELPRATRARELAQLLKTPDVVAWLETQLGDYPFSSTGGLTTSLRPGFALENQTRPTYPVLGRQAETIIVHELAHQWFGDSVALRRWRDIWINEGFATFMEVRWAEHQGRESGQAWLRRTYDQLADRDDFWALRIGDPGAARIFDGPVYVRGAMTLQALRTRVGEAAFTTLLQTWAAQHRGGNATSEQFEALAEQVSGQDLEEFFTAWLHTRRAPAATAAHGLA